MDKPKNNLEKALDKLAEDGVVDSSGAFTLASERARSMMESSLLEDPRAYVLNLVAAGVAGGATFVKVYTDADDCIVNFDGVAPSRTELENLLQYALLDEADTRLRELSLGVLGAKALKPRWVKVSVNDGAKLTTLLLDSDQHVFQEESSAKAGIEIHLKEALSLKGLWRALSRPEATLVSQRCRYAPVPITVNGPQINDLVESQILLASGIVGPNSDDFWDSWSWRSKLPVFRIQNDELKAALFVFQTAKTDASSLNIILNGVSFSCEESLGWDGVGATVYCSHLQKDLSQKQIVRDQDYLQLVVELQKQMKLVIEDLIENWEQLTARAQQSRADLLDSAVRQARQEGDWSRATSILERVVKIQEALRGPSDTEVQRCRWALVDCLVEAGQLAKGIELLLREARLCEGLGRHRASRESLMRADSLLQSHPEVEEKARVDVLEGLALCEARRGSADECAEILERLKSEYQSQEVDDWPGRFQKLKLECQVATGRTRESSRSAVCSRCEGTHLMRDREVIGRKWASIDVVAGHRDPNAALFTNPIRLPLQATVCGDCGHVDFSVKDPKAAWTEFLKSENPNPG